MTLTDKRALVEMVFSGRTKKGERMGVHVSWIGGEETRKKRWSFRIVGRLVDDEGRTAAVVNCPERDAEEVSAWLQKDLLDDVSHSTSH